MKQQAESVEPISPSAPKFLQMSGLRRPKRESSDSLSLSDVEEPCLSRRRTLGTASLGSSQVKTEDEVLVTGVDASDMPIAGENPTEAQKLYQHMPAVRRLDWQLDDNGQPVRKPLKNNPALTAAFAQTRGTEASSPCKYCKDNRGIWRSCVVGFDTNESSKIHGICANCRYSRRYHCDMREQHIGDTSDSSLVHEAASSASTDNSRLQEALKREEEDVSKTTPAQTIRQGSTPLALPKNEPQDQAVLNQATTKNSSLDGKVIPFPLGPETIDDLRLLKQAAKDMTAHLEIVKRRIQQLEDKERHSTNPWELV